MSISEVITSIGTLVTIAAVIVGVLLYIITKPKQAGKPNAKVLIIISTITTVIIIGIVGTAVFISASTTITINGHKTVSIPGFSAATEPPTVVPSPTTTPRVLQINQTMTVANPSVTESWTQFSLVVKTATVDPANNRVTLFIGLTNNGTQTTENSLAFLRFQDQVTGKTTDGSGDGFTDMNYAPTQTIFFNPVFLFTPVPRRTYQLSGSLTGFAVLTPIMITF